MDNLNECGQGTKSATINDQTVSWSQSDDPTRLFWIKFRYQNYHKRFVLCHYPAIKNIISKFLSLSFLNANHDGCEAVWSVGKAASFSKLKQGISYCTSRLFNQSKHYWISIQESNVIHIIHIILWNVVIAAGKIRNSKITNNCRINI